MGRETTNTNVNTAEFLVTTEVIEKAIRRKGVMLTSSIFDVHSNERRR